MVHKAVLGMTELQFQRRNFELSSDEALLEDQKDPEEQEQESHFSAREAQDGAQGSTHRDNDLPRYSSQHETKFVCEISLCYFISSSKALPEGASPTFYSLTQGPEGPLPQELRALHGLLSWERGLAGGNNTRYKGTLKQNLFPNTRQHSP